ncbi:MULTISPECIES: hypothetical protein [Cryobacterium]|uniref:hypothetical protein n=1 Tax=Cryobacterium TaxID=69578 RepID=UPI00141B8F80|nr:MULTISPECIES: hypothetical protein [Cryobacterium]
MFGNTGAEPLGDAGDPSAVSADTAAEGGISSANSETVGHWLDQLPERSWDESPDE